MGSPRCSDWRSRSGAERLPEGLNQIEIWFGILVRKLLKRASFKSMEDLKNKILNFIDYFNRTMAKPFKWTYKGKVLAV
ncbi:MAG: IS3 family transposase [Calothrix sp. SM1_7_51]|nr:IS3 family transposase [Calothrix sp. SM1_7_51]